MKAIFWIVVWTLLLLAIFQSMALFADSESQPIFFFATKSGRVTLDQGEGGGNPFASALIEILNRERVTFQDLQRDIVTLTVRKSSGYQEPDIKVTSPTLAWQMIPRHSTEKRIALVVVFSDYSTSARMQSLPGAKHDLDRIAQALLNADFVTETVIDPDRPTLENHLEKFADRSKAVDTAIIYTTGHGVESEGLVYLLPSEYPITLGNSALHTNAINIEIFAKAMNAKYVNLFFFGGCRNNPFFSISGPK